MPRPLALHVSALNDAEYTTYTASIRDIVELDSNHSPDYDKLSVGVREARAWLKGRYPTLAPATLDSILRLFSPDLGPADALTGAQFFAVLRLVAHVLSGREMDPNLVFVQAHPNELVSRSPSPDHNPFSPNGTQPPAPSTAPAKPSPPSLPPKPTNPFLNRRGSQDVQPQSAPAGTGTFSGARSNASQDGKIPPLPPRKPPLLPPPRHASMSAQQAQPPAREPLVLPSFPRSVSSNTTNPLIQQSLQATRIAQSLKKAEQKLEQERVMEVLKSSAGPQKRVRSQSPHKNSSSSVSPATSTSSADRPPVRARVPTVPTLPPRRNLSPPASTVGGSVRSFEQVATASLSPFKRATTSGNPAPPPPPERRFASPSNSPSRTPPRPLSDLPPEPPPTHPDRKPATLSSDGERFAPSNATPRVGRSKSLHHPTPPPVPPPPRRKRPESAQLTPTSSPFESPFEKTFGDVTAQDSPDPSNLMLSRHLSLSSNRELDRERGREREKEKDRGRDAFSDSMGSVRGAFASLQLRAQPALDVARYKAEGALSRRGFVQHGTHGPRWMREEGEKRLMDDVDDAGSPGPDVDDGASNLSLEVDGTEEKERREVEERARRWRNGGVDVAVVDKGVGRGGAKMVLERDDRKWPAGEGWAPL